MTPLSIQLGVMYAEGLFYRPPSNRVRGLDSELKLKNRDIMNGLPRVTSFAGGSYCGVASNIGAQR